MVLKSFVIKDPHSSEEYHVQICSNGSCFCFKFLNSTIDYSNLNFNTIEEASNTAINTALDLFKETRLARKEFMFGEALKVTIYKEHDYWKYEIYSNPDDEIITQMAGEESSKYESEYMAIDRAIAHCISLEYEYEQRGN